MNPTVQILMRKHPMLIIVPASPSVTLPGELILPMTSATTQFWITQKGQKPWTFPVALQCKLKRTSVLISLSFSSCVSVIFYTKINDLMYGLQYWIRFKGAMSRKEAERQVMSLGNDGSFLVREASKPKETNPYSLTLVFKNRAFNLNIRRR